MEEKQVSKPKRVTRASSSLSFFILTFQTAKSRKFHSHMNYILQASAVAAEAGSSGQTDSAPALSPGNFRGVS